MEYTNQLYEFLEDEFDDSLRSVGYYTEDGLDFAFIRDDVESEYEPDDLDRIYREAQFEAFDHDYQEGLYPHGELQATLRFFDEATEFHFAATETEGVVAAVDAGAVEGARDVITSAIEFIDT